MMSTDTQPLYDALTRLCTTLESLTAAVLEMHDYLLVMHGDVHRIAHDVHLVATWLQPTRPQASSAAPPPALTRRDVPTAPWTT
jgi:hypothetical protein